MAAHRVVRRDRLGEFAVVMVAERACPRVVKGGQVTVVAVVWMVQLLFRAAVLGFQWPCYVGRAI